MTRPHAERKSRTWPALYPPADRLAQKERCANKATCLISNSSSAHRTTACVTYTSPTNVTLDQPRPHMPHATKPHCSLRCRRSTSSTVEVLGPHPVLELGACPLEPSVCVTVSNELVPVNQPHPHANVDLRARRVPAQHVKHGSTAQHGIWSGAWSQVGDSRQTDLLAPFPSCASFFCPLIHAHTNITVLTLAPP